MKAILGSMALLVTIAISFSIGIGAGYAVICGILNAFGSRRGDAPAASQVATAHSLGD